MSVVAMGAMCGWGVADSLSHIGSTCVNGMAGHYNSILIEGLDGDQEPELYLGGSWGQWRFFVNSQVVQ